jgi:hypothetical protein
MSSQSDKFDNLTDAEFKASYLFWMEQFRYIHGNILLYQMGVAPKLLVDIEEFEDWDEYRIIYNLARIQGILKVPKKKDKANDD